MSRSIFSTVVGHKRLIFNAQSLPSGLNFKRIKERLNLVQFGNSLVLLLRQLAGFVQDCHGNDLATLLSSGFEAVSTNRASTQLEQPTIKDILNGMSGQLIVRVGLVANAKCYEVRYTIIASSGALGPLQTGGLHTSSRSMPIGNLTPGGNYQFQVRAIGGSTGYSDWSDPVSHMSL